VRASWTLGAAAPSLAAAALGPACLAAVAVRNVADGAHDAGVARALGLDPQPWHSLDAAVAGVLAWVPVGTLSARAAMGGALVLAAAGITIFVLARALLAACAEAPRLGPMVAVIATWCALFGGAWQMEGAAVGGSAMAAMLAIAPLAALARAASMDEWRAAKPPSRQEVGLEEARLAVFLVALAFSQDPLSGLCALSGLVTFVVAQTPLAAWRLGGSPRKAEGDARIVATVVRRDWRALAALKLAGLAPLGFAVARTRAAGVPVMEALMAPYAGERGVSAGGSPWPFVQLEIGAVLLAAAVVGTGLALLVPRARATAAALVVMIATGLACAWLGAPLGPTRFGAPLLAAVACACVLAGVAMQALVRAIAGARVPLARASAAMVLVLELAAPVDIADEAYARGSVRAHGAPPWLDSPAATWDDAAWGVLPPRAVVLVTDRTTWRRAAAAEATGALRGDVTVVPTFAHGAAAAHVLSRDAALVPLWRDLELAGAPGEASLSTLAGARPVAMAFTPAWAPVLAKHLVPVGLFDRFEPEPRGTSDRRKGLDWFVPKRERLARAVARAHDKRFADPEIADAAAVLLRQRLLDLAASGDRDLVGRAVDDLHAFSPEDPTAAEVVQKMVLGKPRP
jgi:hypothetical protein